MSGLSFHNATLECNDVALARHPSRDVTRVMFRGIAATPLAATKADDYLERSGGLAARREMSSQEIGFLHSVNGVQKARPERQIRSLRIA
jgi:hypothetical protein